MHDVTAWSTNNYDTYINPISHEVKVNRQWNLVRAFIEANKFFFEDEKVTLRYILKSGIFTTW